MRTGFITRGVLDITVRLGHADVIDYELAREILYRAELFAQRRDGDNLLVFKKNEKHSSGFYARPEDYSKDDSLEWLFIDEGFQSDVLKPNGEIGVNDPWAELVDLTSLLGVFVRTFHSDIPMQHKSFIGRGFQQQWNFEQYCKVLLGAPKDRHPHVIFEGEVRA